MMKLNSLTLALALMGSLALTSCLGDDEGDSDYRKANDAWYNSQAQLLDASGKNYYMLVTAEWDPSAQVLIHWFNDQSATAANLTPLYTSTVDVKYKGVLYNGTPFDSSYARTTPADSIFRTKLATSVIAGWTIALTHMHIGDSCRVVVPYAQAYGSTKYTGIPAYSALQFDVKLVGIPYYEAKP